MRGFSNNDERNYMIQNAQVKQNDDNGFRFGWDTMQYRIIFEPIQKMFVMYSNVLLQQDI